MAVDPVCGMTVEPQTAAGSATHRGETYWSCSPQCLAAFKAAAWHAPRGADDEERRSVTRIPDSEAPMHGHQHDSPRPGDGGRFRISGRWILLGFIAIAAYFLFTEHRAHAVQFLPFLLLLACPLLHMFHGHGGHGHHRHGDERREGDTPKRERNEGESQ